MKNMIDYHNLYIRCDVLLLADVFEKFKNKCLLNHGFYPSHYLSATALSCDAMLSMTKFEVDLISDVHIYLPFENGVRWCFYVSKK